MFRLIIRTVVISSCLLLAVAACSKKLDSSSVEKDVVRIVKTKLPNQSTVSAKCPNDIEAKKGKSFRCKLTLYGKATEVKINITDVKKKQAVFDVKYTQAIVSTEAYVAKALATGSGPGSKAACGDEKVVLKKPGDILTCTVTTKGQTRRVKFRVKDTDATLDPIK